MDIFWIRRKIQIVRYDEKAKFGAGPQSNKQMTVRSGNQFFL